MTAPTWHLIKAETREQYGPLTHEALLQLAAEAKISPMDKLSEDGRQTWLRAPMVRALQMDWLIQMPDQYLYGPTNIATIQEFLATGQIDENVTLIHCVTGEEARLADQPFFQDSPHHARSAQTTLLGARWPSREGHEGDAALHQRIRTLERQLMQAQHELDEALEAYRLLRQQFIEETGREPR
ncbi:MAG: hypothetical protein LDL31_01020 [Prosthecobacter sp.]|jgi:hypothetical protein|nr:hypothetical protein [Prosthecobacter sp.]